ncbi:unnamed protein product [Sphagnum troendelagicum]|uniref:WD repeat-containing protein n=1 Tax=Sphagnum troendelagicum TaxID=128251 RepID=A0ABP0TBE1_9BRYO
MSPFEANNMLSGDCNTISQSSNIVNNSGEKEEEEGLRHLLQQQEEAGVVPAQWKFKVLATVECHNSSTDVIGAITFDKSNDFFATGGIARKIRVYAFQSLVNSQNHSSSSNHHARSSCVKEICTPAKLSSLKWHLEQDNIIGCGDYDGVFSEWDIERHLAVSEKDEHNGQRIWSIDYCTEMPSLCASASQDGTVRMWSRSSDQSVAVLHAPAHSPVCCAEFAPSSSFLLALACADSNVYVNDLRKLSSPVLTLSHHKRAASYVRFLGRDCLVSAAIDSTLKLWDISASVDHCLNGESDRLDLKKTLQHPLKTFGYHRNARNFVGLSVWAEGGLIACGSETNEAFAYDCHQGEPILRHDFGEENFPVPGGFGVSGSAGRKDMDDCLVEDQGKLMVSAVCWRQSKESECTLVAANSVGILRVIKGFRN